MKISRNVVSKKLTPERAMRAISALIKYKNYLQKNNSRVEE